MREGTSRKQGYGFGFRVGVLGFRCRGRERRGENEGGTEGRATLLNFCNMVSMAGGSYCIRLSGPRKVGCRVCRGPWPQGMPMVSSTIMLA